LASQDQVYGAPLTHLAADGSVYFADKLRYHMAMTGGVDERVHLVAALAFPPLQDCTGESSGASQRFPAIKLGK